MYRVRTVMLLCAMISVAGCGGGSPTAPGPAIPPREALPELRTLSIAFSSDAPPASRSVAATVAAIDHRGQPMSVGLVSWASSDPTVATITSDGMILARKEGATTITATVGLVTSSKTLTVLAPPPGPLPVVTIAVTPLTSTLGAGQSEQLTATLRDFAGTSLTGRDVSWTSSDDSIALVSSTGIVIARREGTVVIEAASEGKRSGAVITVKAPVDSNVLVTIAAPLNGSAFADSVRMYVTVRSLQPVDSVVAVMAGKSYPLSRVIVTNISGTVEQETWQAALDATSAPFGPLSIAVTATDALGRRALAVVSVVRNPVLTPGSKSPPASK